LAEKVTLLNEKSLDEFQQNINGTAELRYSNKFSFNNAKIQSEDKGNNEKVQAFENKYV
jgi:hypothetical protein